MAKLRIRNGRKMGGIVNLKTAVQKLQKSLQSSMVRKSCPADHYDLEEGCECDDGSGAPVPADVKEGHFAVMADEDGEKPKRFVVPLSCLTDPRFIRLLEDAAEEYGYYQEGALTIPCSPSELEKFLHHRQ